MQKIFILFIAALLMLGIASPSNAKSPTPTAPDEISMISAQKKNTYQLPYPGILPDHPLYKLKVLRDKITEKLISDPRKKVEFYLLQANKGIVASEMLVDKKNVELAKSTALKAENNYTELTYVYKNSQIKPDKQEYEKLVNAAKKHQEVLSNIIKKVGNEDKKTFETVLYFSKTNLEELERIYTDN